MENKNTNHKALVGIYFCENENIEMKLWKELYCGLPGIFHLPLPFEPGGGSPSAP